MFGYLEFNISRARFGKSRNGKAFRWLERICGASPGDIVAPSTRCLRRFRRFAEHHPDIDVDWSSRSLHGFEFTPVEALARDFDLIILDHPFAGDIVAQNCLRPLDDVLDPGSAFVGPSLETYRREGRVWALPVDAACQVAVARPDLLARLGRAAPARLGRNDGAGQARAPKGCGSPLALRAFMRS